MSDLFIPIDIYCERTSAALLAEPVNALTNIAFIIAAYYLIRQLRTHNIQSMPIKLLCAMVGIIGIGSAAFHVFANQLTMWMDVIPIGLFMLGYIWVFFRSVAGQSASHCLALLVLFIALRFAMDFLPEAWQLNGTVSYVPALLYLIIMSTIANRKKLFFVTAYLRLATTCFLFSATMRSVDMLGCQWIPIGTHFIWHIFNGLVLYFVMKSLITYHKEREQSSA